MEVDEFQNQVFKFQRIGSNGRSNSNGTSSIAHPDEEENRALLKRSSGGGGGSGGNGMDPLGVGGRLCGWPSSRIVRVSRASGGKDRHSKVLTSKGLRDRRVRLSVSTAIQFYDLQDRLGYDQPSKAVEWLLKAAASSISELPSLNPGFPDTPKSDEKRSSEITEPGFELDGDPNLQHHQNVKSACSSTSETSKGSGGLSLSRSESRVKARERARERAAEKEKEKENDSHHHQNVSSISQNSSFTELLTAGINNNINDSTNGSGNQNSGGGGGGGESDLGANKSRGQSQWLTPMDNYLFTPSSSRSGGQMSSGFPGHMNSLPQFTSAGNHHHQPELQQFSFVPAATTAGESYNLNFSMSSSSGFNRGTLQSNSSLSFLSPHLQRFNSIDGSMPFFIGSTTPSSNAAVENNHHQFPAGLQLCYGETPSSTGRHSDNNNHKGKGKH